MAGYYRSRFRDEWEATVAQVYADELGLGSVTPSTGIRAVGGSLDTAERVAERLHQVTSLELSAAAIHRRDTVHAVASYVRAHARRDLCVQLLPEARGSAPRLFYIHSAGGYAFAIWALRKLLPLPLAGVRAAGLQGEREIPDTVEGFADIYIEEILRAQPHGPYLLSGFSAGGTIALELAGRLRERGADVALLAMFDTHPPPLRRPDLPDEEVLMEGRLRELVRRVAGEMPDHADPGDPAVLTALYKGDYLAKDMGPEVLRRQLTVYARVLRAQAAYLPRRYPGTVHYFAAEATSEQIERWQPYVRDIRSYPLEVEHYEREIFGDPKFQTIFVRLVRQAAFPSEVEVDALDRPGAD